MNKVQYNLYQCKTKQPDFRVTKGKSVWVYYHGQECDLREILKSEIVIEFDTDDQNKAWEGINFTGINLYNAGYTFEIWDHEGKSPHLHIRNLPIEHLSKDELRTFKRVFIKTYVPEKYLDCVDFSLCGIHLLALEWAFHWKGCYGIKKLLYRFEPLQEKIQ